MDTTRSQLTTTTARRNNIGATVGHQHHDIAADGTLTCQCGYDCISRKALGEHVKLMADAVHFAPTVADSRDLAWCERQLIAAAAGERTTSTGEAVARRIPLASSNVVDMIAVWAVAA